MTTNITAVAAEATGQVRSRAWSRPGTPRIAVLVDGRAFLNKRSAAFDGAVVATVAATTTRKPVLLAGVLPWAWLAARHAHRLARGDKRAVLGVLPGVVITDAVTFVSLIQGSIRYGRPIL